jgi:hypothetical protein
MNFKKAYDSVSREDLYTIYCVRHPPEASKANKNVPE